VRCQTARVPLLALAALLVGGAVSSGSGAVTAEETGAKLPGQLSSWRQAGSPVRVLPESIFEYMDGAGELYLGYRFRHLDVVEYASPNAGSILVELYSMASSDDAFGLLSTDWGGEPIDLGSGLAEHGHDSWPPRALYGEGLLRLWSGELYARIMADRATPEAKAAVLVLGRAVAAGRTSPAVPPFLAALPRLKDRGYVVRPESICFLRSHLVLNSVYFLSSHNILSLDRRVDAVFARFGQAAQRGTGAFVLLLVRYPDAATAAAALGSFRAAYVPESAAGGEAKVAKVEDGWTASARRDRDVALILGCGSDAEARVILDRALASLGDREAVHE